MIFKLTNLSWRLLIRLSYIKLLDYVLIIFQVSIRRPNLLTSFGYLLVHVGRPVSLMFFAVLPIRHVGVSWGELRLLVLVAP